MNEEMNNKEGNVCAPKSGCKCMHHITWPLIIIAFGVVMLLSVFGVIGSAGTGVAFSLIVIIIGVSMIMKRTCRCCCKGDMKG